MYKKTGDLYEMLIQSLEDSQGMSIRGRQSRSIGLICMMGDEDPPEWFYKEMADKFEFIGWL